MISFWPARSLSRDNGRVIGSLGAPSPRQFVVQLENIEAPRGIVSGFLKLLKIAQIRHVGFLGGIESPCPVIEIAGFVGHPESFVDDAQIVVQAG